MMGKKMDVTPNVRKCLEILQKAVENLEEGKEKKTAMEALEYLIQAAEGKPQINDGMFCPPDKVIIW